MSKYLLSLLIIFSLLTVSCRRQANTPQGEAAQADSLAQPDAKAQEDAALSDSKAQEDGVLSDSKAQIEFLGSTVHDFGGFKKPDTLVHYFVYKNVSKVPFVIQKVEPSCHCVAPIYSKKPLAPGAVDSIGMVYDGNGYLPGSFIKSCYVYGNTNEVHKLIIKGLCKEKRGISRKAK